MKFREEEKPFGISIKEKRSHNRIAPGNINQRLLHGQPRWCQTDRGSCARLTVITSKKPFSFIRRDDYRVYYPGVENIAEILKNHGGPRSRNGKRQGQRISRIYGESVFKLNAARELGNTDSR